MTTDTTFQLKSRDVEIGMIDQRGFLITTTQESYKIVRNCLSILEDTRGLPVDFASETEGMKYAGLFKLTTGSVPDFIIQDEEGVLPPRIKNYILIPAYKKVGSDLDKVKALAAQVAEDLRNLYLKVEINEDSTFQPKLPKEKELLYTVMTTSLALEIARIGKDSEVWIGIPDIIRILLMTEEWIAVRDMISGTPPLLESSDRLLKGYADTLDQAIKDCKDFEQHWDQNNKEVAKEAIALLGVEPPTKEATEILRILKEYHQS